MGSDGHAEVFEGLDELDGLDPLDLLEAEFGFVAQAQRRAVYPLGADDRWLRAHVAGTTTCVERYVADEQRLGRMLDYAVIVPRLQRLYEWSAQDLGEPRLLELVRDGRPIYACPSSSATCGALRTCRSRPGRSHASHELAEVGDAKPMHRPASRHEPCRRGYFRGQLE